MAGQTESGAATKSEACESGRVTVARRRLSSAQQHVQSAIEAGKRVIIAYTYRPIEEALNGVLDRASKIGRTVPIADILDSHMGAAGTVQSLYDL